MSDNPNAEIIAIGTEILLGEITDTNSVFMARQLRDIGVNVFFMTTVGDNLQRIADAIDLALERAEIVITCGGLGPTVDDMTRQAVAQATDRPLEFHQPLYVQGALSATSDFVVAGLPAGPLPQIFTKARYSSGPTAFAALDAPAMTSFPDSIPTLYALFDWQRIAPGTPWTVRWLVDGQAFFEATYPWVTVETGANFLMSVDAPPDGSYELQALVNNLQVLEMTATVGIGQLPIDRFAEIEGAVFGGRVLDAATQLGIPSVTIILISEDYSASDFEWKQEQVSALATTDRNGDFQFDRPLSFDTPYSVVIEAEGYLPLAADGFEFGSDERIADIQIELVRG